jgi:hypothetical protein
MSGVANIPAIAAVGGLGELGRVPALEGMAETPRGPRQLETIPDQIREWAERVGEQRAREAWRIAQRGILGTLPELCGYAWLESRGRLFEFQSAMLGGRMIRGGAVADFVIYDLVPGGVGIWRIQGDYWHGGRESIEHDREQRARLLVSWYAGLPVRLVVDLWESDVYRRFPEVFLSAELGVGLRDV